MSEELNKKRERNIIFKIPRTLATVIVAVGIFWLGLMIGSGNIRIHKLSNENKNLPSKLDMSSVQQVYNSLKDNYDGKLDTNTLLDGLKHGLANAPGDPYTAYFTPKEAQDFSNQLNGTFQGIGAELGKDSNNNLIVISPIAGFPAAKAGLKAKDVIAEVNGTTTANMSIDQAVNKIRGPKGTTVTLKIIRGNLPITLKIVRDDIKIPSVKTKTLAGNVGYIQINEFSDDTVDLTTKAANDFKQAGVKGVILDLRGNPGGELSAAVGVSSLWLKNGATVLTERRGSQIIQTYSADGNSPLKGIKTVVLIDDGSASASEITAGALHDNGAATLMGVKSFGKGVVQQIINFGDGSELKVTVASWYTPDGKNINKQGITPDKVIVRSDADIKSGKDPQLDAALKSL